MHCGQSLEPAWVRNAYERVVEAEVRPLRLQRDGLDVAALRDRVRIYCPEILATGEVKGYVAGGFLRDTILGEPPRDLDLYVWDAEAEAAVEARLRLARWELEDCSVALRTWRGSENRVVQIIGTGEPSAGLCLSGFDLTVCCVALDLWGHDAMCVSGFWEHSRARRLVIQNPAYPTDTLRRVGEFVDRGYSISGGELKKLHSLILADMHAQGARAYRFGESDGTSATAYGLGVGDAMVLYDGEGGKGV